MYLFGYGISFFIEKSLIVLNGLKDDTESLELLSRFKVSAATIEGYLGIQSTAQEMESAQIKYHADMYIAGSEFKTLFERVQSIFMDYVQIILLEFKNNEDPKLVTLATEAINEKTPIEWLKRAKEFYSYVSKTPKAMARIEKFNFTTDMLRAELDNITQAENAKSRYLILKGKAEESINKRNSALEKLKAVIDELLTISEVAFKDNKQFMEKCGIRVFSEGYKRSSAANNTSNKTAKKNASVENPAG
jgi:hypothetical protein